MKKLAQICIIIFTILFIVAQSPATLITRVKETERFKTYKEEDDLVKFLRDLVIWNEDTYSQLAGRTNWLIDRDEFRDDIKLIGDEKKVYWYNGDYYWTVVAPSGLSANYALVLPLNDGDSGQAMITNGSGVTSWSTPAGMGDMLKSTYDSNEDGVVAVPAGGLGVGTLTDGGVLLGSGTGAITPMAVLGDGEIIVGDGTTDPVAESGATARTSLGLAIGSDVQAYDDDLADLADGTLSKSKVEDSGNWDSAYTHVSNDGSDHSLLTATPGTASASKALIVDASKDIDLDGGDIAATEGAFAGEAAFGVSDQDYTIVATTDTWKQVGWQSQEADAHANWSFFTKNGDEGDDIGLNLYAKGGPTSAWPNVNASRWWYDASASQWYLDTVKDEVGADDDLTIVAGGVLRLEGTYVKSQIIYDRTTGEASNVYVSSSGYLYRSNSSLRYKTVLSDMTAEEAGAVLDITPVKFHSKHEADDPEKVFYGLLAEDVAEHYPEAATYGPIYGEVVDEPNVNPDMIPPHSPPRPVIGTQVESYDINFLVAALIKQVQVQNERIKELETAALKQ